MRRLSAMTMLCLATLLGVGMASAEPVQKGNLLLSFGGRFTPHALPRDRDVPVRVDLTGSVRTTDGSRPPQLRTISIAVNRHGLVSTEGLPICHAGLLESTDSQVALARCGSALVGHGHFGADVQFPSQAPFPVEGKMLAFNGRSHGKPVILVHIHGSHPVEATVVLTFTIHHPQRGKFGTVLSTRIPLIASDLGYVTNVSLDFGRKYRYAGKQRSFVSARCAAPDGFPGALFSFARGTFTFADGKQLTTTLARDCVVR
jgi:hypothetical protein